MVQSPLERLIQLQTRLDKKFPAFHRKPRFITMFTIACHQSLSWARWIQPTPSIPVSLRSILIVTSYLWLGLLRGLPSDILIKILYTFLFLLCTCPSNVILIYLITLILLCAKITVLLIRQLSSSFWYQIPVWSKYSPKHPVPKEPRYLSQYWVWLRTGRPGEQGSIPGRNKWFFL
jgi:hypothetical protein